MAENDVTNAENVISCSQLREQVKRYKLFIN